MMSICNAMCTKRMRQAIVRALSKEKKEMTIKERAIAWLRRTYGFNLSLALGNTTRAVGEQAYAAGCRAGLKQGRKEK